MDLSTFRTEYPEFHTAADVLVTPWLARASLQLDADLCGDRYDEVHGLLTAHLLALSPHGKNQRLIIKGTPSSIYWSRFENVRIEITAGLCKVV